MNFRTAIQLQKEENQIDYSSKLLLIGSCFSENMAQKLDYFKFNSASNPFGILFNPAAIETLIVNAIKQKKYTEKDIFQLNERWHCFDAHSDKSALEKNELINNLNNAIELTNKRLNESTHIIFTLGTAWVYQYAESGLLVGNCHKVPQKKFKKKLLSVTEIESVLNNLIDNIREVNKNASLIFTVSPVRHLKDGFVENSQSKAHLLTAIHQLTKAKNNVNYFPSYEIMMDDLRDYRFYAHDMIHPNPTAIIYIWEQFKKVWLNEKTFPILKEVDSIQKGLAHRPFNEHSEQHQQFLKKLQEKIQWLSKNHSIKF